ncbi:sororin isoform X2 [Notamacropus eugenii]|uniref:sororin isoform X2 n=1 Tax=Notamacropus eugenii TaxID=9315 RepID=UPI003B67B245
MDSESRAGPRSPGAVASPPPAVPVTLSDATSLPGVAHTDDATAPARPRFLPSSGGSGRRACARREGGAESSNPAPSARVFLWRHFRLGGVFEYSALSASVRGFLSARERFEMSATLSRSRSRSRSGAAGERGGGGARRSDPPSPPPPPSALRRSQRKSGPVPEARPQPPTPAPRMTITLKKIAPRTAEAATPGAQRPITVRKIEPRSPEASPSVARRPVPVRKLLTRTTETPPSQGCKSTAKKNVSSPPEVTLLEKENSPPLQENTHLDKGSSPVATGPALEVTSTVLGPLTPNVVPRPDLMDARDLEMSRKVRRSYSRLSDLGLGSSSTSTPNYRRHSFFGFERLLLGEELENVSPVVKESKSQAVASATEPQRPDSTLPGIIITKEKRRKRKVPEILKSELDEWAAAMNAQFEAAEKFDLLVE